MINFIKKNAKVYMILSMLILIGTLGVTYAYYSATVTNDSEVVGTAGGGSLPTLVVSRISTEANGNLIPIDMDTETLSKAANANPKCIDNKGYTACQIYSVTVTNNTSIPQSYNIELTTLGGATTPNVDAVTMGLSNNSVASATSIKDNGLICTTNSVTNGQTTTACYFMVIIKNTDGAQTDSGTFGGTVTVTSSTGSKVKARFGTGEKLTTTIENLYNNASKIEVNAADGLTYNYATGASLMNDRFGTSSASIDSGNIRYYGASPYNYVDIGDVYEQDTVVNHYEENAWILNAFGITSQDMCLSYANCTALISLGYFTDEASCQVGLTTMFGTTDAQGICGTETVPAGTTKSLYRIIGLFKDVELADGSRKDLIKVMRNDTIGNYSWDQSASTVNNGWGVNEWSQADLMKLLNPNYENETVGGSLYWNSGTGTCYSWDYTYDVATAIPCDFASKGLSTSAQNSIEVVNWNLGGWNTNSVFANQIYSYERQGNVFQNPSDGIQRSAVWEGRVALAYPSDYGYAVDLGSCNDRLNYYENCIGTNWMYPRMTFAGNIPSWLLTPNSDWANSAWDVGSVGDVPDGVSVHSVHGGVSPVFYLDSELTVESGTGMSNDQYVLW